MVSGKSKLHQGRPLIFSKKGKPGYLDGRAFEDSDLVNVPPGTIVLSLENSKITDAGILSLPMLKSLRCIDLDSTSITDESLKIIAEFKRIEEIWLENTAISDKGIQCLHGLTQLRFVSLIDCDLSERAVRDLKKIIPGINIFY